MDDLENGRTYVLLIGASKYPNWPTMDIPNVQVNLKELELLLADPLYFGIARERITILEDQNLEDTNNGILEFFANIKTPWTTIIVYYAGHGLQSVKAVDDLFLSTRNIRETTFEASSIRISELRRLFSECIAARKILLLDCCYAGKITRGFMSDVDSDSIAKLNDFEGTYIMAASSEYERARFDPENPKSPTKFTGKFLEVIKNGIEIDNEYCTLNSIYSQIRSSFHLEKDAPRPIQIGQNNIGNLPIFKNRKFVQNSSNDEKAWAKAVISNTIYSYNAFIEQYPDSKYATVAESKIQNLEDQAAWEKACIKNTIGGYRHYLGNYNVHLAEAKRRLHELSIIGQESGIGQSLAKETDHPDERIEEQSIQVRPKLLNKKYFLFGALAILAIFIIWYLIPAKSSASAAPDESSVTGPQFGKLAVGKGSKLYYTDKIYLAEAERVVKFMDNYRFSALIDSISYQLDAAGDTILFKYNLYNKEEFTPAVKQSMNEFGKLLFDSLYSSRPLRICGGRLSQKIEYASLVFAPTNVRKDSASQKPKRDSTFTDPGNSALNGRKSGKQKLSEQDQIYYEIVHNLKRYVEAQFPGGPKGLDSLFTACGVDNNFAKEKGIPAGEHSEYVYFAVDDSGHAVDFRKSFGDKYGIQAKMFECLKNGPLWQPGRLADGRPAKTPKMVSYVFNME